MAYWLASRDVAVDEDMIDFMRRAKEIVHIPTKPTPTDYKTQCLADAGYVLNQLWHAPKDRKNDSPQSLDISMTKLGVSRTQQVILELLNRLSNHEENHII